MVSHRMRRIFLLLVAFRVCSVFFVTSSFVPDEYWQGPEVAHKLVFGFGHLTWEWITGLRSIIYPGLLSIPYLLLEFLGLDSNFAVIHGPRVLQAIITAVGDWFFLRYSYEANGWQLTRCAAWFYLTNWFNVYCGPRTLGNTMETSLNLIGLYLMFKGRLNAFIALMTINFVMRPSAIAYWIPYIPVVLQKWYFRPRLLFSCSFIGLSILAGVFALDSLFYGKPTVSWWNFIDFNYIQGHSALFGVHPFHWYMTNCLPLLCGIHFAVMLFDVGDSLWRGSSTKNRWPISMECFVALFYIALYSALPHKELRFMLPVIPNIILVSSKCLCKWYDALPHQNFKKLCLAVVGIIAILDFAILLIASRFHLVGVPAATEFINDNIELQRVTNPRIWIMMPCYSVPVYTSFHNPNASVEFFTCPPPELKLNFPNQQDNDFSDIDLNSFTKSKLKEGVPNYVMAFSPALDEVLSYLPSHYSCFKAFNTFFPEGNVGAYVHVLCQINS